MARKIMLFTGQWADLSFEDVCKTAHQIGYDGLEIECIGDHLNIQQAIKDSSYIDEKLEMIEKYGLSCSVIGAHLAGQCVGDLYDARLDIFAPEKYRGDPKSIRSWAIDEMKATAIVAKKLGCDIVSGFMGSPIWKFWYSFPQTTKEMIDAGYKEVKDLWEPILKVFEEEKVKFALEVHPTEIAFDFYTSDKLFNEVFENNSNLGITFDPSHLLWQGISPHLFIRNFPTKILNVHMKDVAVNRYGTEGILGSFLNFGDPRRGWNFVSLGHGNVNFDLIMRELNNIGYKRQLSVEWEDSGMDRIFGATESLEFVRKLNFSPSTMDFDSQMQNTLEN